jgi:riboflavin synthase
MFTGILKAIVPVVHVQDQPGLKSFSLRFPESDLEGLERGASVSIDGVCCTVTGIEDHDVSFDAMEETLTKTTLGNIKMGDRLNIERSFKVGDEIGGHIVSGRNPRAHDVWRERGGGRSEC